MDKATVLHNGKLEKMDISKDKPDYSFTSAKDFFAYPSNLATGLGGISGGRILLGAKATLQAISLTHPEVPLVQSVSSDKEDSFISKLGKGYLAVKSTIDGEVVKVTDNDISVKGKGGVRVFEIYHNFNLGQKTFIDNKAKVKVGDKVKAGDILATSNYTDEHGNMAFGVNLRTAVMPYRSGNFEDAFVVTESGAKKLEAEQMFKIRAEQKLGVEIDKRKYISLFPNKFFNQQLSTIDDDGVVKIGTIVKHGDPLILALSPKALKTTDIALGKLNSVLKHAFIDHATVWDHEAPGEVADVSKAGDLVTVNVKTRRPLNVGDKLCMTPDHDVLTTSGWKNITQVVAGEEVYSLNLETNCIEYATVQTPTQYDYHDLMYTLETTQVSMCVTPNHKLVANVADKYELIEATSLFGKTYKLKNSGKPIGGSSPKVWGGVDLPTDVFIQILGYYLSEGELQGSDVRLVLTGNTTELKLQKIRNCLDASKLPYTFENNVFTIHSLNLVTTLKLYGQGRDKHILDGIFGLSQEHMRFLYEAMMLGDGENTGLLYRFICISEQLAGDFQRLCLHLGYSATVRRFTREQQDSESSSVLKATNDLYISTVHRYQHDVEINKYEAGVPRRVKESWEHYVGQVYCLSLDKNHTFYIRRNGLCHWTGNSCVFGAKGVCGCYDDQTEVLTSEGFKLWEDVTLSDKFACNINNRMVFHKPQKLFCYEYEGLMYGNKNSRGLDYLVTPDHRMWCRPENVESPYRIELAKDMYDKKVRRFLYSTPYLTKDYVEGAVFNLRDHFDYNPSFDKKEYKTVFDLKAFASFLGFWISEGSMGPSHIKRYTISISQHAIINAENCKKIEEALNGMGIHWYHNKAAHSYCFGNKPLYKFLQQLGKCYEKYIPKFCFDWPLEVQAILFDSLQRGDGSLETWENGGKYYSYTTTSLRLARDIEILSIYLGYSPKFHARVSLKENQRQSYNIYIRTGKEVGQCDKKHGYTQQYNGNVYCAEVPGNLVFVRRNKGRPFWCGNSLVPDAKAPTSDDGKPVDIILNSMSVTSRIAPSLLTTLALGKVAEKLGHVLKMPQFTEDSAIDNTIDLLKKHKISDTEQLYDPVTGKHVDVLTGPLYYTRLIHIAEDKESSRSAGKGYSFDMQPTHTSSESSKRLGNLSTNALLSHAATAVLKDIGTVKATKNDEYWRRLTMGLPVPSPKVPFIFDKFIASLQGAGINVTKKDHKFQILPMTDKQIINLSSGSIDEPLTYQVKGDKIIPEKGGLFDPEKTGVMGEKYNHVNLGIPVPNPISEDFLRKLLKVTQNNYEAMVISGDIIPKLKAINIDDEIKKYSDYLKSGKKTDRDDSVKLLSFLKTLKQNKLTPADLILTKAPIIPTVYRPAANQGDFSVSADVNYLYKDLIHTSNMLKSDLSDVPKDKVDELKRRQYDALKAVYGLGESITVKNKEKGVRGLLATTLGIQGGSAKTTMFQSKVVNKPMDLVGRAVLAPSAYLDLDEASVPVDLIWKIYSPFISRRLAQRGIPVTKALEYIKTRNSLASEALHAELQERPGIITRDPALHKFNLCGFYLKPNADKKDTTIKLNPLVFKGFNADNDGDQLNVSVPAGEDARKEVIEKMLPSRNLLSAKTYAPMFVPSNESSLGLFQLSSEDNKNKPQKFLSSKDVLSQFNQGKLNIGDRAVID